MNERHIDEFKEVVDDFQVLLVIQSTSNKVSSICEECLHLQHYEHTFQFRKKLNLWTKNRAVSFTQWQLPTCTCCNTNSSLSSMWFCWSHWIPESAAEMLLPGMPPGFPTGTCKGFGDRASRSYRDIFGHWEDFLNVKSSNLHFLFQGLISNFKLFVIPNISLCGIQFFLLLKLCNFFSDGSQRFRSCAVIPYHLYSNVNLKMEESLAWSSAVIS